MVSDVIDESRARLACRPADVAALRAAGRPMVRFSQGLFADLKEIRGFLFRACIARQRSSRCGHG